MMKLLPGIGASLLCFASWSAQAQSRWTFAQWGLPDNNPVETMGAHAILLKSKDLLILNTKADKVFGTQAFIIKNLGGSAWDYLTDRIDVSEGAIHEEYENRETWGGHFCGGQSILDDDYATVLALGGDNGETYLNGYSMHRGLKASSFFHQTQDPGKWLPRDLSPNMNQGRWYPTCLNTPDGRVMAFGGPDENGVHVSRPEILTPAYSGGEWPDFGPGWQRGTEPPLDFSFDYPHMYVMPDGRYLNAWTQDYTISTRCFNPLTLSWTKYGTRNGNKDQTVEPVYNSSTMFILRDASSGWAPTTYVVRCGGIESQDVNGFHASKVAQILKLEGSEPAWQRLPDMNLGRCNHLVMMLPGRRLLAVNGSENGRYNNYDPSVDFRAPEIYTWSTDILAGAWERFPDPPKEEQKVRGYHSTASLIGDGRVCVAGGEPGGFADSRTAQLWSPPYLDDPGNRPIISSFSTDPFLYGTSRTMSVSLSAGRSLKSMSLIALPSVTHSFNMNNRYVELKWTSGPTDPVVVYAPENANLAPPGWYMLFVEDSAGSVSESKIVRVTDGYSRCAPSLAQVNGAAVDPTLLRSPDNGYVQFSLSSGQSNQLAVEATVPEGHPSKIRLRIEHRSQLNISAVTYVVEIYDVLGRRWLPLALSVAPLTRDDRLDVHEFTGWSNYRDSNGKMKIRVTYSGPSGASIFVDEVQIGTRNDEYALPPPR